MKIIFTILSVSLATICLLLSSKFLPNIPILLNKNEFINGLLKYQMFAFCIAILFLLTTLQVSPQSKSLLKFGNIGSLAIKEKWLGINGGTTWRLNSIQLALFISLATGIFMFLAVKYTDSLGNFTWNFLPLIILISLTNSFSEETLYRIAINGNLTSNTSKLTVLLISAVLFGIPHYFGFPTGVIGVIMSAALGYILSKATYETQGIGIAWTIHFLQDVIIFTALFMMKVKG